MHDHHHSHGIDEAIDATIGCYQACLAASMHHCLEEGGEHVEPRHFRLMMSCAEICRTAAHMMMIGSEDYRAVCAVCVDICDKCANDCERHDRRLWV